MFKSVLCCWGIDFGLLLWIIRKVWWPFKDVCDCYRNEERGSSSAAMRHGLILHIAISLCLCFCLKLKWFFFFPDTLAAVEMLPRFSMDFNTLYCLSLLFARIYIPGVSENITSLKPAGFVHAALNQLFPSYFPQAAGKTSKQVVVQTAEQRTVQCCTQRDLWNPKSTLGLLW